MIATHLGFFNTASSRTHVGFQFSTHASAGANVAPLSAFEAADLRIYKAADGAAFSATQRSSSNGITMTSPFDSLTGFHDVDIDLTDNTDAGFYASGCRYSVVLAPDTETIDSQTITAVVLAYFEIGVAKADVTQFGGTAGTFASGIPETKVASIAASAITAASIASDAITDAKVASDVTIASVTGAVGSVTGNVGGNVTGSVGSVATGGIAAASFAAGAIDAAAIATDAIGALELAAGAASEIATAVRTELTTELGRIDATVSSRASQTSVDTVDDFLDTEVAAIKAKTDNLPAAPAATSDIPTANQNADALLARNIAGGSSTGRTVTSALRKLRNKVAIATGTMTVYQEDDTTADHTATVTTTAGDPITTVDPA